MSVVVGVIYVALALLVGLCGRHRRFGFVGFFVLALLITPVLGLLLVYVTQERPRPLPPAPSGLRSSG